MTGQGHDPAVRARQDARLLKWLRREVNRDLRYWRSRPGALPGERYEMLTADCKARLEMLRWAESWQSVRASEHLSVHRPEVRAAMLSHLDMVMAAVRRVAAGYRGRDGWRDDYGVTR